MEEILELTLLNTHKTMDVRKIQKLIASPEDWDGDIWESSDENDDENTEWDADENIEPIPLKKEEFLELK